MNIQARFFCESVTASSGQGQGKSVETVRLRAVYSGDHNSPNYSFSEATPQASLEMMVTNKNAWGAFEPGKVYDLAFSPAEVA